MNGIVVVHRCSQCTNNGSIDRLSRRFRGLIRRWCRGSKEGRDSAGNVLYELSTVEWQWKQLQTRLGHDKLVFEEQE